MKNSISVSCTWCVSITSGMTSYYAGAQSKPLRQAAHHVEDTEERKVMYMPKVMRTATEERRSAVRAEIKKYMELRDLNNERTAKMLGIAESTFLKKKKRPETFTLGELWDLAKIFKCPVETLIG